MRLKQTTNCVADFHQWLLRRGGRCHTNQVCSFYSQYRHYSRRSMGSLKSVCKRNAGILTYHKIACGESFVEAIGSPSVLNIWTDIPCISPEVVAQIKEMDVLVTDNHPMSNALKYSLLREKKKAVSKINRDDLRSNQVKIDELLSSGRSLREMSNEYNITTSDMAIALLGWEYIDAERLSPGSQSDINKRNIYEEALEFARDDHIAGYKLSSSVEGFLRKRADSGEKTLQEGLKKALHLTDADFKTEDEVRQSTPEGSPAPLTPDVLFREPQEIMGRMCYWADAKNSVVIPGISPDKIVQDIKRQTDKYIEAFGPGMLFWGKFGFDQGIVDALSSDVLHVTPRKLANDAINKGKGMLTASTAVKRQYTYSGGMPYINNQQCTPRVRGFASPFADGPGLSGGILDMLHGMHPDLNAPDFLACSISQHQRIHKVVLQGPGHTLGGGDATAEDRRACHLRLLDRCEAEYRAQCDMLAALRREEEELLADIRLLFATPEQAQQEQEEERQASVQQLLAQVTLQCRLMTLTEKDMKALKIVAKVVQNIAENPEESKFRSVKLVASLSASTCAIKCLNVLGFVAEETRLVHSRRGEQDELWGTVLKSMTPFLPAVAAATALM